MGLCSVAGRHIQTRLGCIVYYYRFPMNEQVGILLPLNVCWTVWLFLKRHFILLICFAPAGLEEIKSEPNGSCMQSRKDQRSGENEKISPYCSFSMLVSNLSLWHSWRGTRLICFHYSLAVGEWWSLCVACPGISRSCVFFDTFLSDLNSVLSAIFHCSICSCLKTKLHRPSNNCGFRGFILTKVNKFTPVHSCLVHGDPWPLSLICV